MAKKKEVLARGLIHVHGPDNSGKTLFALTSHEDPEKICFLDGDAAKSRHITSQMGIGKYVDLTGMGDGMDELEYHKMVLGVIDNLPDNTFDVIVYDNANEFYKGGHTFVRTNRPDFRKHWNPRGDIAGAQEWIELRQTHYPRLYTALRNKAPLVIICTPEKAQSDSGVKTGLMEPSADDSLRLAADVVVRLARNTRDPAQHAPVGLIVKNATVYVDGKLKKAFPDRVNPFTWEKIEYYLNNPIHDRAPNEEETPDEFEMNLITGSLNPEQKALYEYRKRIALMQEEENLVNAVLDANIAHANAPKLAKTKLIRKSLLEAYPDLTVERVEQILEEVDLKGEDDVQQE